MSYQVLARKWRPKSFQQMVGQEPILRMLINALDNQRLHHAYLFTGTRGVGKTSLARLLAKCLNCETQISSNPCNQYTTCQSIDAGRFLDLIEIDAASRTKVEDTREILDNVQYAPSQGRFKIYLIDEVHMLSGHSFNALLKTLEEPPAHVKFLLATTDPKRLPITILSRCLQFNLKRVPIPQIAAQLQHICQTENIAFEAPALDLISHAADGSMRDALSLLDQAIAYCGATITKEDTHEMLGSIEQDALFRLLNALADQNGLLLLNEIAKLAEHAPDFDQVLEDLLSILHQINIAQLVPEMREQTDAIKQAAQKFSPEEIQLYYQIALIGRRDLAMTPNTALGFEMIMLRMLAFKPTTENQTVNTVPAKAQTTTNQPTKTTPTAIDNWSETLAKLQLSGVTQAIAANCTQTHFENDRLTLAIASKHAAMLNQRHHDRIQEALTQFLGKPIKLEIKVTTDEVASPAKAEAEVKQVRQEHATQAIQNDTQVKNIMNIFDATLDMDSIKALDTGMDQT